MIRSKLTEKLKSYIKKNYAALSEKDFAGDTLIYLRRVKGAAKSRKIKKDTTLKIGKAIIPKDSELYAKIAAVASMKGQTIEAFMKDPKNRAAVEALIKNGGVTINRESEYLMKDIKDLPRYRKVFLNEEPIERLQAIRLIQEIQSLSMQYSEIVMISYEIRYDLSGNLYLKDIPTWEELMNAADEAEEYDMDAEMSHYWTDEFLDDYEGITYVQSNKPDKK